MAQFERRLQKLEQKSGAGRSVAFLCVSPGITEDARLEAAKDLADTHGLLAGNVICSTHEGDGPLPPPQILTGREFAALIDRVAKSSRRIGDCN